MPRMPAALFRHLEMFYSAAAVSTTNYHVIAIFVRFEQQTDVGIFMLSDSGPVGIQFF